MQTLPLRGKKVFFNLNNYIFHLFCFVFVERVRFYILSIKVKKKYKINTQIKLNHNQKEEIIGFLYIFFSESKISLLKGPKKPAKFKCNQSIFDKTFFISILHSIAILYGVYTHNPLASGRLLNILNHNYKKKVNYAIFSLKLYGKPIEFYLGF
jgi:hypothetical protein